jgi:hypothetical protein
MRAVPVAATMGVVKPIAGGIGLEVDDRHARSHYFGTWAPRSST